MRKASIEVLEGPVLVPQPGVDARNVHRAHILFLGSCDEGVQYLLRFGSSSAHTVRLAKKRSIEVAVSGQLNRFCEVLQGLLSHSP